MLIFVCSPMRGDRPYTTAKYNRNMRAAPQYSKTLEMSKQLLERCDEVWVFDENGTSEGMKGEIELASQLGKQVRYR